PPAQRPPRDTRRGGIVELQITLTQLRRLAATPAATGPWAPLITDLAHQAHAQLDTTPGTGSPDLMRSPAPAGSRDHRGACDPALLDERTDPADPADAANTAGAANTADMADSAGVANPAGMADSAGVANGADRRHAD
ncbi:hypothetical protein, partial [Microbispora hainanensis]|uniref:hypothetical protein n=1 Tax=Microbispora hainanensis TaxID=568844 RepID=UPI001ABF82EE